VSTLKRRKTEEISGLKVNLEDIPKPGTFLISHPTSEDIWERALILVCEHDERGSFGLIINRPLPAEYINSLVSGEGNMKIPKSLSEKLLYDKSYEGGPVIKSNGKSGIYSLHNNKDVDGAIKVLDGLYWGGNFEQLKEMAKDPKQDQRINFYFGFCSWSPRQLEHELKLGTWFLSSITPGIVFEPPKIEQSGQEPVCDFEKWRTVLYNMGGEYTSIAEADEDLESEEGEVEEGGEGDLSPEASSIIIATEEGDGDDK